MNLTQLHYFCELARTEHMTRAANNLCITQSTLSKAISSLEKELGYELFDHRKGSIKINQQGRIFLRGVESALSTLDKAVIDSQEIDRPREIVLRVATPHPYAYGYIGTAIGEFLTDYPDAHLYNEVTNAFSDVLGLLMAGRLDCIIAPKGPPCQGSIAWRSLCTERIVAIVRPSDSLPEAIFLRELAGWNFCLSSEGSDQRSVEDEILGSAHLTPNIVYSGADLPYIVGHLQIPNAVAIIPESGVAKFPAGAALRPIRLKDPFCKMTLGVYFQRNNVTSALATFIRFLDQRMGTFDRPLW